MRLAATGGPVLSLFCDGDHPPLSVLTEQASWDLSRAGPSRFREFFRRLQPVHTKVRKSWRNQTGVLSTVPVGFDPEIIPTEQYIRTLDRVVLFSAQGGRASG